MRIAGLALLLLTLPCWGADGVCSIESVNMVDREARIKFNQSSNWKYQDADGHTVVIRRGRLLRYTSFSTTDLGTTLALANNERVVLSENYASCDIAAQLTDHPKLLVRSTFRFPGAKETTKEAVLRVQETR